MTAPGVTVVPLLAPTREEQLEREVNELHAELELARCELGQLPGSPTQEGAVVGAGFVAEADGWLWFIWRGECRRLERATVEQIEQGDTLRTLVQRELASRRRFAS